MDGLIINLRTSESGNEIGKPKLVYDRRKSFESRQAPATSFGIYLFDTFDS